MLITTPDVVTWLKGQLAQVETQTLCYDLSLSLNSKGRFCASGFRKQETLGTIWACGAGDNIHQAIDRLNHDMEEQIATKLAEMQPTAAEADEAVRISNQILNETAP